jgi:hypothetical protein
MLDKIFPRFCQACVRLYCISSLEAAHICQQTLPVVMCDMFVKYLAYTIKGETCNKGLIIRLELCVFDQSKEGEQK